MNTGHSSLGIIPMACGVCPWDKARRACARRRTHVKLDRGLGGGGDETGFSNVSRDVIGDKCSKKHMEHHYVDGSSNSYYSKISTSPSSPNESVATITATAVTTIEQPLHNKRPFETLRIQSKNLRARLHSMILRPSLHEKKKK